MPKTRAGSGQVKPNLQFQGTEGITIPVGTTAQRNPTPQAGEIRYNTDLNVFEGYTGSAWGSIGPYPFATVDYFVGDGSTSEFTLSNTVDNSENTIVTINGVQLRAEVDYDLSYPNRIRFIDASDSSNDPPAALAEITVRYFQPITAASVPAGSIGLNELNVVDGTAGQFLRTDGAGNLSFATVTTDPAFGGSYIEGVVSNASIKENSISIRELAVSPGTIGQVLATDGSGNLAFISVAGGAGGSAGSFFDLSGTIALSQIPDAYIPQSKIDINGTATNGYVLSTDGTNFQWTAPTVYANTTLSNLGSTAVNASLLPATDSTIDLGSNTKKWRDLYLSGSTLYLGSAQITAAGAAINLPAGSTVGGSNIGAAVNNFSTIAVTGQSNVVADSSSDTLTLAAGTGISITTNASTDVITITNASPNVSQNVFATIAVAGQSNVVADSATDTLTLVAGSNITITTNASTDTITINSEGGSASNSFATIAVAGQSNVVADSGTDTLTLVAGSGMSITTDAGTDTVTIASTVTSGIALTALSVTVNAASGGGNLSYNNTTGVFSFTPPDFPSNITDLADVTISSPSNGQVLKYNSSTSKWVNAADLTGDGGSGIGLGDLSVTTAAASSNGALSYSNSTGIFTFTPPNLSSFISLSSISASGDISYNNSTGAITFNNSTGYITRAGVSVSTASASSGGALSYNNSTGVFTFTPADVSSFATNSFTTIAVATQNNVVADSSSDTLTLVAGTGIAITTNDSTDTVTITNSSPNISQNVFSTIVVAGQSNVEADSAADILTLAAGSGISITTNASTDTVTITSTVSAGATAFTGLSDRSNLTVDQFYLPAITRLVVTASGSSAYLFDQYTGNNPTIYAISGTTIAFDLGTGALSSHPFLIRFSGANYNTGLTHVTSAGVVTTGSSAQGKTSGTLYWKIPAGISGTYGYLCSNHGSMAGIITVKDISAI